MRTGMREIPDAYGAPPSTLPSRQGQPTNVHFLDDNQHCHYLFKNDD
jgi:hypothetical protein